MTNRIQSAAQDFRHARSQANLQEIVARLTGKSVALLSYEDVRRKLKAEASETHTLREIPLDAIVGSVGRYNDFTRSFLPRQDSDQDRWARVKVTVNLKGLPPIDVYQIDQAYFVLDGNHRVSIARRIGASTILARVTEVRTKVPLSPDVQPDDLIVKAEYADFLERTRLDECCPGADLSVTAPGKYQAIEEQIAVHHYYVNQERQIPHAEALAHWYDEVYSPVVRVIRERGVLRDFPGRTETDLYLWIVEHRAALEAELGLEIEAEAALADLTAHFSPKPRRVVARVSERIRTAVTPDELESGPPPGQWRRERLATRQADHMFADVLVAINGKQVGWCALEHALFIARHENTRVYGLHVMPAPVQPESQAIRAMRAEFDRRCKAAGVRARFIVESGSVPRRVCQRARWTDLVILSLSHPPGPQPIARLGSGLSALIRGCPRPVLIVPGTTPHLHRALLAYDGSPKSEEALFVATYLSVRRDIPLVVVTVVESGRTTPETLRRAKKYLQGRGGQVTFVEQRGEVAGAIMSTAETHACDLIIMGGYGFSPVLEVVLGSAVDKVLRTSRRPLLICR